VNYGTPKRNLFVSMLRFAQKVKNRALSARVSAATLANSLVRGPWDYGF